MTFLALRCLSEYANVRVTIFETKEQKVHFVHNFARNMIDFTSFSQPGRLECVLSNNRIFREVLRLVHKFQNNFGIRAIAGCEQVDLVPNYFTSLYRLTVGSF